MRTPGDDIDLVHGLLYAEGVIATAGDIVLARYCAGEGADGLNTYNVLDVTLADGVQPPEARRQVVTTSACGLCGATSIEQVMRATRFPLTDDITGAVRADRSPRRSCCGSSSGRSRPPAACTLPVCSARTASLVCVREDVGRHNAVDKVIGWAIRQDRLPLRGHGPGRLRPGVVRADPEGGAGRAADARGGLGAQLAGR